MYREMESANVATQRFANGRYWQCKASRC